MEQKLLVKGYKFGILYCKQGQVLYIYFLFLIKNSDTRR